METKNLKEKEALCSYYIENKPFDFVFLYTFRGATRLDQNKNNEAFDDFTKAIIFFQNSKVQEKERKTISMAYMYRSFIYVKYKNYQNAIDDISESINKDFSTEKVLKRADFYILAKKYINAIDDCNLVLEKSPLSGIAYYTRGRAMVGLNYLEQAEKDFKIAANLGCIGAYSNLGAIEEYKRLRHYP